MKKLLNLKGAHILGKNELQSINGGGRGCGAPGALPCPQGYFCCHGTCVINGTACV